MLKLENLSKYYYSTTSVTCALRKVNLEFKIGEFVAICGESGSGKTTLLNIISGFDTYEDGELYFNGKQTSYFDNNDWEEYRKEEIAFIFQNYNLIDSFTVLENVEVTYIIDGYSKKEARLKAKEVLKLVGLENDYYKKATKLSGGQKQRLSIARALAKETNIIVADEPTGNLDATNGESVLKLLKELSKDKLVIVVTHNLAQIEPFLTRKIRLHDGEIVSDEKIEEVKEIEYKEKNISNLEVSEFKKSLNFSLMNLKAQPMKSTLLMCLIVFLCIASFVFFVNFKINLDENKTKELDHSIFINSDDTRLLVKASDNRNILDSDYQKVKELKKVQSVEKYDYITDMNYYRNNINYHFNYDGGIIEIQPGVYQFIDCSQIVLDNNDSFMRSYHSIDESMLSAGRLPVNDFEMVVYSSDESILNTQEIVLFRNDHKMGVASWFQYTVTIVGLLKDPSPQAYFSDDICKIMEFTQLDFLTMFYFSEYQYSRYNERKYAYSYLVIDPENNENEISFNGIQRNALSRKEIKLRSGSNVYYSNEGIHDWYAFKHNLDHDLSVSDLALGLSKDAFYKMYDKYLSNKKQFAIFIDDYAYTDDVISELASSGFESLSCFRSSVSGYDVTKLINRYINLFVSVIALLLINVLIVFIGLSILKVKKNDFIIFKMLGLSNKQCKMINFIEVFIYGLISNIILVVLFIILNAFSKSYVLLDTFKYVKYYDFIIIFIVSLVSLFILANKFTKYISKNTKVSVLKEE